MSIYDQGYKPLETVSSRQRINPNALRGTPIPDLSKIPTGKVTPLTPVQQNALSLGQKIVAERLAQTASTSQLSELAQRGGETGRAAANELSKRGMLPKITPPVSRVPTSTPPAASPAQSLAQKISLPVPSVPVAVAPLVPVALGALLQKPVGDLGEALGRNALPLVEKVDEALGLRPSSNAREALQRANQRYAQALDAARVDSAPPVNPPPFTGGQMAGVAYSVSWVFTIIASGETSSPINSSVTGPVGGMTHLDDGSVKIGEQIVMALQKTFYSNPRIISVNRADGQPDTGGNPPPLIPNQAPTIPAPYPPADEWLYGFPPVTVAGNASKMQAATPPMPMVKGDPDASPDSLGIPTASGSPEVSKSPGFTSVGPTVNAPKPKVITPSLSPTSLGGTPDTGVSTSSSSSSAVGATGGFTSTPATQLPATQVYPNGMTNELYNKSALPEFKQVNPPAANAAPQYNQGSQVAPNPPPAKAPEQFTIPTVDPVAAGILGAIAAGTVTTTNLLNQINQQTRPENQQANAKAAVCSAMQPDQCGGQALKQATDPINQKADDLLTKAGAAASLLDTIFNRVDAIKGFLEKMARSMRLDKVYNLLTFLTVIHNASMLSNSISTTLMDSLSLGLATFGIKDENESPIDIQEIINKSVEDTVKGVIGTANYNTLSERWKSAVRVYQAGANIVYQVRSLWDSAKSLNELTGANVGRIGNALRRDGVVSENAYPAMPDSPVMVNSAMVKLQNLEEAASHLSSITSETYGITETVAQIKKDQDDFKKLVKESPITNGIANDAQKAKDDAAKLASVSPSISTTDLVKPD